MREDKLRFSKCPYCRRHGISAMGKFGYRSTLPVICIYCQKTFKAKLWISALIKIAVGLASGFCALFSQRLGITREISLMLGLVAFFLFYYLGEYFAPMREVERRTISINKAKKTGQKKKKK